MIEIYPNKLDGLPFEVHATERRMTIGAWLDSTMKEGYKVGDSLALSAKVNGEIVDQSEWHDFVFLPSDHLELRVEPRGTDPFSITIALFAGVKAAFGALMPAIPGTPTTPGQGKNLNQASVRGNKVKLGEPIREVAGTQKIYPDYLLSPRKYFQNKVEQWTELALCVGVGKFEILANNVRIGDTSLLSLGADADYRIFGPGETVTGYTPFNWWHTVSEVGASSTGSAGLELTESVAITPAVNATSLTFSGYGISIPSGAGAFPSDWTVGLVIRIIAPYTYTVIDAGGTARDVVQGPLAMLNPTVGDSIEIVGGNAGLYTVDSYTPGMPGTMTLNLASGDPANGLTPGTGAATIGPRGLLYKITSISPGFMTVDRLTTAGAVDVSFPGFDLLSTSAGAISVDQTNSATGYRGPFPACPEGEKATLIEFDIFLPNGLCGIGSEDGNVYEWSVVYDLEWRDMANGPSAPWNAQQFSQTAQTLDQIGFSTQITMPYPMRPEVRMRQRFPYGKSLEVRDTVQWYGLKGLLPHPTSYPGCTTIGIRVRTSDRIAAQTESLISVTATRILPIRMSGGWTTEQPTREIIPFAAYVAKSLGYTDAQLDLVEMDRLNNIWRARGDYFDNAYSSETTAEQVLNHAFGAGFAELSLDHGRIRPVRDEPRTVFEQMYTPQNMTTGLKRTPRLVANPDQFSGVQVTYTDMDTWTEAVVDCTLPGDSGGKIEKITAVGVTDKTRAWRIGMRRRRVQRYRADTFYWSTEADALVSSSRYLSYCAACDDVPGYPQSAIMLDFEMAGSTVVITASEQFDWNDPAHQVVAIRRPDGSLSGPYAATKIDDFTLSIPSIDFLPDISWKQEPPHLLFGTVNRWSYPVLITDVSPNGMSNADVTAVGYDIRVYESDDLSPP